MGSQNPCMIQLECLNQSVLDLVKVPHDLKYWLWHWEKCQRLIVDLLNIQINSEYALCADSESKDSNTKASGDPLFIESLKDENDGLAVIYWGQLSCRDQCIQGGKHGTLNWKPRFDIIFGTARGLAYLHEQFHLCIIHRDMKPGNILLDDELQPKIAEFGLPRLLPEDQSHLNTKFAGTLGYTAPEYALQGQLSEKVGYLQFPLLHLKGEKRIEAKEWKQKYDIHVRDIREVNALEKAVIVQGNSLGFMAYLVIFYSYTLINSLLLKNFEPSNSESYEDTDEEIIEFEV
ncbi:hypothetical protein POM88_016065 [Heracleum sosnowskyi]|uniref:non-specific serine/threonine protein kinase n=1 Tax=Heracleum sosnowskyi TaxID=360622 RepID=A0AAD8MX09_9APIA|nr:hypothetical protein POM88_016065 [Heracleum sosnowskyi]